jgi:hypothetical protein
VGSFGSGTPSSLRENLLSALQRQFARLSPTKFSRLEGPTRMKTFPDKKKKKEKWTRMKTFPEKKENWTEKRHREETPRETKTHKKSPCVNQGCQMLCFSNQKSKFG